MKVEEECIPCILKMSLAGLRSLDLEPDKLRTIYHDLLKSIMTQNSIWDVTSAELVEKILIGIMDQTRIPDPFIPIKKKANETLLSIYNTLFENVIKSENPVLMAAKLSIIGNTIDVMLSKNPEKNLSDILAYPMESLSLNAEKHNRLLKQFEKSKTILVLADNAGEGVMDKLLFEVLKTQYDPQIYYIVRKNPALNDMTTVEAEDIGISQFAEIMTNGIDGPLPGTVLSRCSKAFLDLFHSVDMVISKGGGNFESLIGNDHLPQNLFFMLMCKCEVHSRYFNIPVGNGVIWQK